MFDLGRNRPGRSVGDSHVRKSEALSEFGYKLLGFALCLPKGGS